MTNYLPLFMNCCFARSADLWQFRASWPSAGWRVRPVQVNASYKAKIRYYYLITKFLFMFCVSYILKRLQTSYQVLGDQIPNFGVNSGVSNLGVSYILKCLQTPYLVFSDQILNFSMSSGVFNLGVSYILKRLQISYLGLATKFQILV